MNFAELMSNIGEFLAPYLTKDYLLYTWDASKIIVFIIFLLIFVRIVIKWKFFKRVKSLNENVKELNQKMSYLIQIFEEDYVGVEVRKPKSLIDRFLKKK